MSTPTRIDWPHPTRLPLGPTAPHPPLPRSLSLRCIAPLLATPGEQGRAGDAASTLPWHAAGLAGGPAPHQCPTCKREGEVRPATPPPLQPQPYGMQPRSPASAGAQPSAAPAAPAAAHPVGVTGQGHQPRVPAGARHALQVGWLVVARVGAAAWALVGPAGERGFSGAGCMEAVWAGRQGSGVHTCSCLAQRVSIPRAAARIRSTGSRAQHGQHSVDSMTPEEHRGDGGAGALLRRLGRAAWQWEGAARQARFTRRGARHACIAAPSARSASAALPPGGLPSGAALGPYVQAPSAEVG